MSFCTPPLGAPICASVCVGAVSKKLEPAKRAEDITRAWIDQVDACIACGNTDDLQRTIGASDDGSRRCRASAGEDVAALHSGLTSHNNVGFRPRNWRVVNNVDDQIAAGATVAIGISHRDCKARVRSSPKRVVMQRVAEADGAPSGCSIVGERCRQRTCRIGKCLR